MDISDHDRERIAAAIRAAEAKTSGEIVCVLAQTIYVTEAACAAPSYLGNLILRLEVAE
jgi:uncharacterized membrane protein